MGVKHKLVRGGSEFLGMFFPRTGVIEIYVDEIRIKARANKDSYKDLKQLVMFHEEAHYLHHANGVVFTKEQFKAEERLADDYAVRRFCKTFGRWPDVKGNTWYEEES